MRSFLALPVRAGGAPAGFLGFNNVAEAGPWSEQELLLLRVCSEIIGSALERKRADEALAESEARFRAIFEQAPVGVIEVGLDGHFLRMNQRICRLLGYTPEELVQRRLLDIVDKADIADCATFGHQSLAGVVPLRPLEKRYVRKDGTTTWAKVVCFPIRSASGDPSSFIAIVEDVSERKWAEAEMARMANELEAIFEALPDQYFRLDSTGEVLDCKLGQMTDLYLLPEQFLGKRMQEVLPPGEGQRFERILCRVIAKQSPGRLEYTLPFVESPQIFEARVLPFRGEQALVIARNITEQKQVEQALRESESRYRSLFENNHSVMLLIDPLTAEIVDANPAACAFYGWTKDELTCKRITEINTLTPGEVSAAMASACRAERNQFEFRHRLANGEVRDVQVSAGTIEVEGRELLYSIVHDITEHKQVQMAILQSEERFRLATRATRDAIWDWDPHTGEVWRNEAFAKLFGYVENEPSPALHDWWCERVHPDDRQRVLASVEQALARGKEHWSAEFRFRRGDGSYAHVHDHGYIVRDADGRPVRMIGAMNDVTNRRTAVEELRRSYRMVRKAMEGTVEAVATVVERRDPYTAGHQRRVAALACAIAREMCVSEERIEGLRLAATIHDVGKIAIPAEILSKPGRLDPLQYNMIKTHPQTGHDILCHIEFPWPIAQTILQHHERLDGSGYPDGLHGEEILLEARILAVADAVEAMASHRPYRPALGIERALEEISQASVSLFDPEVVAACIRLFREKGWQFPS